MNSFVVVEVSVNAWTAAKTKKIVMQSSSELLCYRQALTLQKLTHNCVCGDEELYFEVIPEDNFNA